MDDGNYPPIQHDLPPHPEPPGQSKPPTLKWRIHYRDGQTANSNTHSWAQAPSKHIVGVAWRYGDGPVSHELGTPYYANMGDWICRVWDPSLYLRKLGVKMGRWTTNQQFADAWDCCITKVTGKPGPAPDLADGGLVCSSRPALPGEHPFEWLVYYDDGQSVSGNTIEAWNRAPCDGVLAVYFHYTLNGVLLAFGRRRLTYYYWKDTGELENLDFIDQVLPDFPQFKYGETTFSAKSYTEQAQAIKAALEDTLEDL